MTASLPHAVILGLSPTGLYVARELGAVGVPLLGVGKEFACGSLSRYFRHSGGVWYETCAATLLERLQRFSSSQASKPVLIPTSDYYVEFLINHYSELVDSFHVAPCYENVAGLLLDKLKFYALCARHQVATPGLWKLSDLAGQQRLMDEIPLPCIVKPALIHLAKPYMHGRKVLLVESRSELVALANTLPEESGGWLIQEIIPGEESRIMLVAGFSDGTRNADDTFSAVKLRQYPPGFGSASRAISKYSDEAVQLTGEFIDAIGFRGIFGSEFKRDPRDGKLKMIEINARPTLWFALSHAAGKRLAHRAYCDAAGLDVPAAGEQRDGIVWRYGLKDFASACYYRFSGNDFVFSPPDLAAGGEATGHCWPVFSASDPLPVPGELCVYASRVLGRLF